MPDCTPLADQATELLPYYVYALVDARAEEPAVFYVGMGQNDRVTMHAREVAQTSPGEALTEKHQRICELRQSGLEPREVVIARFEMAAEAKAVEATLIKWVYGLDQLTNAINGRGARSIRSKGDWARREDLDVRREASTRDGSFARAKIQGLHDADAFELIQRIELDLLNRSYVVSGFSGPLAPYDPSQANGFVGRVVRAGDLDLVVVLGKSRRPSILAATTRQTRARCAALEAAEVLGPAKNILVDGERRYRDFTPRRKYPGPSGRDEDIVAWVAAQICEVAAMP